MKYTPHTPQDKSKMLSAIGIESIDELFSYIPRHLISQGINIPSGLSEMELVNSFKSIASRNNSSIKMFAGGGFYNHFIPAAVDAISSKPEFFTAYTPYQPECSQGTLQAIYEFQTLISRLTGLECSNASVYDGGTALVEAVFMAQRATKRREFIIDGAINPVYIKMIKSHCLPAGLIFNEIYPTNDFGMKKAKILESLNGNTAAVITANPNFFGIADDYSSIANKIHENKSLLISSVYPMSLGILKKPSEMGVDIATGDGQSLGNPLSFGGPYLGFIATNKALVRQLPGRIAGRTVDENGKTAFVLTIQAREQHIRRHKATSNICSNQMLCALRALVYTSLLGKQGFKNTSIICHKNSVYLFNSLSKVKGVELVSPANSFFNEFIIKLPIECETVVTKMLEENLFAGLPLKKFYAEMDNYMLVCATETTQKNDIDEYCEKLCGIINTMQNHKLYKAKNEQ